MSQKNVLITIINEVSCHIKGLQSDHLSYLCDQYAMHTANYFHQVSYKLGTWDGKKKLLHKDGITFVYLLQTLVPKIKSLGYTVTYEDKRRYVDIPDNITIEDNMFAQYSNDDGDPFIMRDYQIGSLNEMFKHGGGIIGAGTGAGKAQTLDSQILTTDGWITMGDITLKHQVITPNNKVANITGLFPQPEKDVFLVTFHDGAKVKCCGEHLWEVIINDRECVITDTITIKNNMHLDKITIPVVNPIDYRTKIKPPPIDAFIVGVMISSRGKDTNELRVLHNTFGDILLDVNNEKIIPNSCRYGSILTRKQLLAGLLSIDGVVQDNKLLCKTFSSSIAEAVCEILQSLGHLGSTHLVDDMWVIEIESSRFHELLNIKEVDTEQQPFLDRQIISIELIDTEPTQCISIDDPDHLYITNSFIVTHNTIMCAAVTKTYGDMGLRCITIVPNISLVKQSHDYFKLWGLDSGRLDGKIKDTNHPHLVTTWQSLQNQAYLLTEFDVLIVDECQTAKAGILFKLITEYAYNAVVRIGMTGSMPPHPLENIMVRIALGNVIYNIPVDELQKAQYLSTIDIKIKCLEEEISTDYFPDYASETDYLRKNELRNKWVADKSVDIAGNEFGNTLLLVSSKPVGRKLLKLIEKNHPEQEVYYLNGDDGVEERSVIYNLFKTKNHLIVIATVQIAGVGLSIDRIFNLVMLDIGKSFARVVQAVGRGLRKNSKNDKSHCDVYDICSNLKYSGVHLKERTKTYKKLKYPFNYEYITYKIDQQIKEI